MKYLPVRVLGAAACASFLGLAAASAQPYYAPVYAPAYVSYPGNDFGFYFNADLGPDFMTDFHSARFGFPGNFSARPGVRFDAEPGFNFLATRQFTLGAEFETGVAYNYLNSVKQSGNPNSLRGDYYQVPLLANLVLKLNTDSIVVPYIGLGGGGDYSEARIHRPGYFGFERESDAINPAVSAMAGVRFRLNPISDVGIGYKFLAAIPSEGSYIGTHAIMASFTVKF